MAFIQKKEKKERLKCNSQVLQIDSKNQKTHPVALSCASNLQFLYKRNNHHTTDHTGSSWWHL